MCLKKSLLSYKLKEEKNNDGTENQEKNKEVD